MPTCNGWIGSGQLWECIDAHAPDGENCCRVGCQSCVLYEGSGSLLEGMNERRAGNRFVACYPSRESRDATGVWRYPRATRWVQRVPRQTAYAVAQCYATTYAEGGDPGGPGSGKPPIGARSGSDERFTRDHCDCHKNCPPSYNGPYLGFAPTCWFYSGLGWPPRSIDPDEHIECTGRMSPENAPLWASAKTGRLYNAASIRMGTGDYKPCTTNWAVPCWGHKVTAGPYDMFNSSGSGSFGALIVSAATMSRPMNAEQTPELVAANAALAWLNADLELRLNSVTKLHKPWSKRRYDQQDHNLWLDWYESAWNYPGSEYYQHDFDALPAVATFPQSHLARAGCPVTASYVIVAGTVRVSLVLQSIDDNDIWPPASWSNGTPHPPAADSAKGYQVFPLVRIEVVLDMGTRVNLTGSCPDVTIVNHGGVAYDPATGWPQRFARVAGITDEIVYRNASGEAVRPLPRVVWRGHLGWTSNPQTQKVIDGSVALPGGGFFGGAATIYSNCLALYNRMYGLGPLASRVFVPAYETHAGTHAGEKRTYGGGLYVGFA